MHPGTTSGYSLSGTLLTVFLSLSRGLIRLLFTRGLIRLLFTPWLNRAVLLHPWLNRAVPPAPVGYSWDVSLSHLWVIPGMCHFLIFGTPQACQTAPTSSPDTEEQHRAEHQLFINVVNNISFSQNVAECAEQASLPVGKSDATLYSREVEKKVRESSSLFFSSECH